MTHEGVTYFQIEGGVQNNSTKKYK